MDESCGYSPDRIRVEKEEIDEEIGNVDNMYSIAKTQSTENTQIMKGLTPQTMKSVSDDNKHSDIECPGPEDQQVG